MLAPAQKPRKNLAGLFKAKAQEVVKEKRLGVMQRFASSALQSTINRVEKCASLPAAHLFALL